MEKLFLPILLLLFVYSGKSQIYEVPTFGRSNEIEILIRIDSVNYRYEKYETTDFNLLNVDTLFLKGNYFLGKTAILPAYNDLYVYELCDPNIDYMRKISLQKRNYSHLLNMRGQYIGYGDIRYDEYREKNNYKYDSIFSLCFEEYRIESEKLKEKYLSTIHNIYNSKVDRYEWIKNNHNLITETYIREFFKYSTYCGIDRKSAIEIIAANADDFLQVGNELFNNFVNISLRTWTHDANVDDAISALKKSNVKKYRKKLIKHLKRQKLQ